MANIPIETPSNQITFDKFVYRRLVTAVKQAKILKNKDLYFEGCLLKIEYAQGLIEELKHHFENE